jgi:hypothetical protein
MTARSHTTTSRQPKEPLPEEVRKNVIAAALGIEAGAAVDAYIADLYDRAPVLAV